MQCKSLVPECNAKVRPNCSRFRKMGAIFNKKISHFCTFLPIYFGYSKETWQEHFLGWGSHCLGIWHQMFVTFCGFGMGTLPSSRATIRCGTCLVIVNDKSLVASLILCFSCIIKYNNYTIVIGFPDYHWPESSGRHFVDIGIFCTFPKTEEHKTFFAHDISWYTVFMIGPTWNGKAMCLTWLKLPAMLDLPLKSTVMHFWSPMIYRLQIDLELEIVGNLNLKIHFFALFSRSSDQAQQK